MARSQGKNKFDELLEFLDNAENDVDSLISGKTGRTKGGESKTELRYSNDETITSSLPPYPGPGLSFEKISLSSKRSQAASKSSRRYSDDVERAAQEDPDESLQGLGLVDLPVRRAEDSQSFGGDQRSRASSKRTYIWDMPGIEAVSLQSPSHSSKASHPTWGKDSEERAGEAASSLVSELTTDFHSIRGGEQSDEDLKKKVEEGRTELSQRRARLKALQAELGQLRRAIGERRGKLEKKWETERASHVREGELALARHRTFIADLQRDARALGDRAEDLGDRAARARRGRPGDLALARRAAAQRLKEAREKWLAAEKRRLTREAERREKDMKAAAVREMEPELHGLIHRNRQALARQREAHALQLQEEKLSLERGLQERLLAETQAYQAELEAEGERLRQEGRRRARDLAAEGEAALKGARDQSARELEGERLRFEAERRRRRDFTAQEEAAARRRLEQRVGELTAQLEAAAAAAAMEARREGEARAKALEEATRRWQEEERERLREELERGREGGREARRRKRAAEVDMVLAKLKEEHEGELSMEREAHAERWARAAAARGGRAAAAAEAEQRARARRGAARAGRAAAAAAVGAAAREVERTIADLEQAEKETERLREERAAAGAAGARRAGQLAAAAAAERGRLAARAAAAQAALDAALAGRAAAAERRAGEARGARARAGAELAAARGKVEALLGRRRAAADDLRRRRARARAANEDLAGRVDALRARRVVG